MKITTDKCLIFSGIMLILFTISIEIMVYLTGQCPDALVIAFFGAFSIEGGCCAFVHKISKQYKEVEEDEEIENVD